MSSLAREGASRKRKERDGSDGPLATPTAPAKAEQAPASNRLLAGYLAHEFLTHGTLLGRRWDPARSGAPEKPVQGRPESEPGSAKPPHPRAYADVAWLLKTDGAHIPGIVNPAQLAQWLRM